MVIILKIHPGKALELTIYFAGSFLSLSIVGNLLKNP